jgi:signal transduction histidine kinase
MKKSIILISLLIINSIFIKLNAQTHETDSLENLLMENTKEDTIKVNLLNEVGNKLYRVDIDKTLKYAKEAGELADKLSFKKGKAESLRLIGIYYEKKSDYLTALEYCKNSLEIFEELGNKKGISSCYNNIGIIYWYQGDYLNGLECYQKSLKISEQLGDKKAISKCLNNIGLIYSYQSNYPKALEYYKKSLKLYEEISDTSGISYSYNNIGIVYGSQGDYPKALEYFLKSLKIRESIGDKRGISYGYYNIGENYLFQGDYSNALKYLQKSLKINIEIGNKSMEALSYVGLASLNLDLKRAKKAYNYSKKAYTMAEEINESDLIKKSSEILAKSSEALGLYKEAYKYHVVFKTMNDSLYNEENIRKIAGLEHQYINEKEKQALELEQQKKDAVTAEKSKRQKTVSTAFILGFILMTGLVIVILWSFIQKRKANRILAEQKHEIEDTNEELLQQKEEIQSFARELEKANQTKDKFFSIIAHDLKSPFNSILGFSDLLLENHKVFDEDKREELLKYIKGSSQSAFNLLENLFTWALSQSGKIEFLPEKLDLRSIVKDVITTTEESAKSKEISLFNNITLNEFVYVDENIIRTVLRNLIFNSIKFTHRNGKITVSSSNKNDNGFMKVIISDTGIGMDKDQIDDLFRIEKSMSKNGTEDEKGTGLGLIICKEFVEKQGGKIYAESTVGKGSSFIFTIPIN